VIKNKYEIRRSDIEGDTQAPEWFVMIVTVAIIAVAIGLVAAGHSLGRSAGASAERERIVDECNTNQRFNDRKLRYFCAAWPIDSNMGEVES